VNPEVSQSLSIGRLLSLAFTVLRDNFVPFYLTGLVIALPSLILTAMLPEEAQGLANLLDSLLAQLAIAALTYGSYQYLAGHRVGAGDCIRYGASKFGRVFGLALISNLIVLVGIVLLVSPGLILATMFAVSVPALLAERLSISDSLKRSTALTKGYRWQVFGLLALTIVSLLVAAFVAGAIMILIFPPAVGAEFGPMDIVIWFWTGLYYAVLSVITATIYYRLREIKEGLGIEQLAAVFD
jgi:uncharacterized membrane protein